MAYLRGDTYVWADTEGLHIWQRNPPNDDYMRESGWAEEQPDATLAAVHIDNATLRKIMPVLARTDWSDIPDDEERAVERAGGIFGTIERLQRENATLTARVAALTEVYERAQAVCHAFARLCTCPDEFDSSSAEACVEYEDALDLRILELDDALAGTRDGGEGA